MSMKSKMMMMHYNALRNILLLALGLSVVQMVCYQLPMAMNRDLLSWKDNDDSLTPFTKLHPKHHVQPQQQQPQSPARILMGIFTTQPDVERRNLVRDTYLSYNKGKNSTRLICSLQEALSWVDHDDDDDDNDNCQIIYTFVVGAATSADAPLELLNAPYLDSMTFPRQNPANVDERDDVLYLNIQENMNQGKSLTWFKYASQLIKQQQQQQKQQDSQSSKRLLSSIDWIAKVDTDTLIYPDTLLALLGRHHHLFQQQQQQTQQQSNQNPNNHYGDGVAIYGGEKVKSRNREFMQGGFYFLSPELASYVTSKRCPRLAFVEYEHEQWNQRVEDLEMGHFVDTYLARNEHHNHILRRVQVSPKQRAWWHHGLLKDEKVFRANWNDHMARITARQRLAQLRRQEQPNQQQQGGGAGGLDSGSGQRRHNRCLPQTTIMNEMTQISDSNERRIFLQMASKC